jgi:curved DNA-binding protein CbpA
MTSDKDPYDVLNVPRDATADQIRRKYRKLLRRFHPDMVAADGDPEMVEYANRMTAQINAAWEILSDAQRRREYDEVQTTPTSGEAAHSPRYPPHYAPAPAPSPSTARATSKKWAIPRSRNEVLRAVQQTIAKNGWHIDAENPDGGSLRFHTRLSLWTWTGHDVTVYLSPENDGTRIDVMAKIRRRGLSLMQVTDWGEGERLAKQVIVDACKLLAVRPP